MLISILALNTYQSVKFNFEHFIKKISQKHKLKSYYYTLNKGKIDIDKWMRNLMNKGLSLVPPQNSLPIILSIDDTMVEKQGEHFENRSKCFDHAMHNGSNYLNGHCFVSLLMSIPVCDGDNHFYINIPVAYRMWTKEKSKLEMAAELVTAAMEVIGGVSLLRQLVSQGQDAETG